jgi:tetratricopeptide (TPR) repeat protein
MDSLQSLLSDYLQCELYHTLGAYRVAHERLAYLSHRLRTENRIEIPDDYHDKSEECTSATHLLYLAESEGRYNQELGRHRHASPPVGSHVTMSPDGSPGDRWPVRDPHPRSLPLTRIKRFSHDSADGGVRHDRIHRWDANNWKRVPRFYSQAIDALTSYDMRASPAADDQARLLCKFAESLIAPRDGASNAWGDRAWLERRRRRIDRYERRRQQAHEWLSPPEARAAGAHGIRDQVQRVLRGTALAAPGEPPATSHERLLASYPPTESVLNEITQSHLAEDHAFPLFVIRAQAEAHLSMHAVEAWQSMCLGERAKIMGKAEREWLQEELDQSIALSTFAYCVSRTAPWIFAEHEAEREEVFESFVSAWENLVPARCMWIAAQVSLLALHRRAYAYCLKGDAVQSYNDYHKLQRLIRDTERRVRSAPIHVEGALIFLAGLDAEAHHHIGELYRSQHAHKPALEHFEAASHRLEQLRDDDRARDVLTNSRWYVQLQISRGKASYEMGRHKEALSWHLHAWRAFLELVAADTRTETNTEAIEEAIEWLERIKYEPELRKSEVAERLGRVVNQLDRITVIDRFGALAAEILLRLGHLLFVLNVGYERATTIPALTAGDGPAHQAGASHGSGFMGGETPGARVARTQVRRTLAFGCLLKAAECDPHSTLVGADLLKARFRFNSWLHGKLDADYANQLRAPKLAPIEEQWPRGGDDYEQLARVAEYLMLDARLDRFGDYPSPGASDRAIDGYLARDLLLSLFMSTDSINVRKSQIHRFLMEPESRTPAPIREHVPAIELVCMRRYSSPFPLLPRPSAFRALGGGYFVRLRYARDDRPADDSSNQHTIDQRAYGIVIDPGVDFVESLYRTGYSLSDVHMIVLTHDHVDHLGALDPLLSLIHVRSELLSKQARFDHSLGETCKVRVLVSSSVHQRYDSVKRLVDPGSNEFAFTCFQDIADESGLLNMANPCFEDFPEEFEIVVMSSSAGHGSKGGHLDLSALPSHGLCFRARGGGNPSVALTSDTPAPPPPEEGERHEQWRKAWEAAIGANVLVVHLGSVPLTELRRMDQQGQLERADAHTAPEARDAGQDGSGDGRAVSEPKLSDSGSHASEQLHADETALLRIQGRLQEADERLRGQIEYAQWLRSHVPAGAEELTADLVGVVPDRWSPPPDHNYLSGLLSWARAYRAAHERGAAAGQPDCDGAAAGQSGGEEAAAEQPGENGSQAGSVDAGLFVVGELSEELGTMRNKVASRLNELIFDVRHRREELARRDGYDGLDSEAVNAFSYALTADIGLHVCVCPGGDPERGACSTKVLCTTCDLDTDRAPNERYHLAHDIYEVCVKGENEGIFYNCLEHDPARQDDPTFLEKLERFDIFGR